MVKKPVISAMDAAMMVADGMTISTSGFVASGMPETLTKALEKRFLESGSPKNLTLLFSAAQGNKDGSGGDHFAHEGMLKRVIAGHYNMNPDIVRLINSNKVEAYNLPQGTITQLFRDIAARKIGTITHVGLNTFVDPRIDGGKLNETTKEDVVSVVHILGQELLLYKSIKIDIGFIRGTYADESGNVTLEHECCVTEVTSIAQAVRNSGGKVFVQVEKIVPTGTLDPKLVKIPGIYVDAIVISEEEDSAQCIGCEYDGSMTGEYRAKTDEIEHAPMSAKKIIGRRAAMELEPGKVVNLGIGAPEYVSAVANEEGIADFMTLTVEAGPVGGIPQGGKKFGGSVNVEAILDQPYQFDFYDGGGVDLAFLGLAQADKSGNVNVSRFGPRIAGCGGFINITQNAKKVCFCGTFTAGGIKIRVKNNKLVIDREGSNRKIVDSVEQITFSGAYANKNDQSVMYITERAVFELRKDGVYLTEVAPGIDIQTQIFDQMDFVPKMDPEGPKLMDARIFGEELMNISRLSL